MRSGQAPRSAGGIQLSRIKSCFAQIVGQCPRRRVLRSITAGAFASLLIVPQLSSAEPAPRRGGTLEFASTVEPGNYDCHGNTSFAFLHPVAPHYSTLLKFDTGNYPQVVGDLAQFLGSLARPADLYVQAAT